MEFHKPSMHPYIKLQCYVQNKKDNPVHLPEVNFMEYIMNSLSSPLGQLDYNKRERNLMNWTKQVFCF